MEFINSLENMTIKKIKKLKQKKYREREKKFIAEGHKFLDFNYLPEIIVISEEVLDNTVIMKKIESLSCRKIIVDKRIFSQLSSQENSQGVILVYSFCNSSLESIKDDIVVLDKIQDPGNLGTIIRIVDAVGLRDIILTKGSVDCYNEKVVRSSMGSIFNLNIVYLSEEETIEYLEKNGYQIVVTALDKNSISYTDMEVKNKNAIVFGSEGNGVSVNFIKKANKIVMIPIYGTAESLNVAIASGVMLYKFKEIKVSQ